jgi:hypothetical protein
MLIRKSVSLGGKKDDEIITWLLVITDDKKEF